MKLCMSVKNCTIQRRQLLQTIYADRPRVVVVVVVVVYGTPVSIMHRPTRLIGMHRHQEPWRSELAESAVGAEDRRRASSVDQTDIWVATTPCMLCRREYVYRYVLCIRAEKQLTV